METSTLTLREIAEELGTQRKLGDAKLLNILRDGELTAVFYVPDLEWISIPTPYWQRVTSGDFASLHRDQKTKKKGTYTVSLTDFSEIYVDQVLAHISRAKTEGEPSTLSAALRRAIVAGATRYEVRVRATDWQRYLEAHPPRVGSKKEPGRPQRQGWRELIPIVSGYYMAVGSKEISTEAAAREIYALASQTIQHPLAALTIRDALATASIYADSFRKMGKPGFTN